MIKTSDKETSLLDWGQSTIGAQDHSFVKAQQVHTVNKDIHLQLNMKQINVLKPWQKMEPHKNHKFGLQLGLFKKDRSSSLRS